MIEKGVVFEGQCKMEGGEKASVASKPPPPPAAVAAVKP
jgi:hypothetical protein